jgi:putative membrane protein
MSIKLAAGTLAFAPILIAGAARAQAGVGEVYYGHYGMMGGGGWLFGPIMMVIFFALLVGAIILILRLIGVDMGGNASGGGAARKDDDPLEILRMRFARGEIDREEFEERRKALGG